MEKIRWKLDPAHSQIGFKVRHMMVSNVSGEFEKFNLEMETDGHEMTSAEVDFEAEIDSITTKVDQRDNHLKSPDFFDAANFPKLKFKSTKITKSGDGELEIEGNLTIRDITKKVTLKAENFGVIKDPSGSYRTGFDITGKLNRLDFGLNYNPMLEAGGAVVGKNVNLIANIEVTHDEA